MAINLGIVDATGTDYASPARYRYYQDKLQQYQAGQLDRDINAYLDAHPEFIAKAVQDLQQQTQSSGFGESYNPTSLMLANGGETDPRKIAYNTLMQSVTPTGGSGANVQSGAQVPSDFSASDPYQGFLAQLTPSQRA